MLFVGLNFKKAHQRRLFISEHEGLYGKARKSGLFRVAHEAGSPYHLPNLLFSSEFFSSSSRRASRLQSAASQSPSRSSRAPSRCGDLAWHCLCVRRTQLQLHKASLTHSRAARFTFLVDYQSGSSSAWQGEARGSLRVTLSALGCSRINGCKSPYLVICPDFSDFFKASLSNRK